MVAAHLKLGFTVSHEFKTKLVRKQFYLFKETGYAMQRVLLSAVPRAANCILIETYLIRVSHDCHFQLVSAIKFFLRRPPSGVVTYQRGYALEQHTIEVQSATIFGSRIRCVMRDYFLVYLKIIIACSSNIIWETHPPPPHFICRAGMGNRFKGIITCINYGDHAARELPNLADSPVAGTSPWNNIKY